MRELSQIIINAQPSASNQTSVAIDASQIFSASIQGVFSDNTAAGTLTLQASNDLIAAANLYSDTTPTNWTLIPNATVTVVAGASVLILVPVCSFRSIRAVFTSTNGSATANVTVQLDAKSV